MDNELIKFKNVKKRFGKKEVLETINLDIPENKITGIIGASGEGKTTILKLLVGFYKPTKGEILYSKRDLVKDFKKLKNVFGFATEDGSFHDKLSVIENLMHFGYLHGVNSKELKKRADELLDLVGLNYARHTMASDLSMGMKKRLDVAISLLHDPEVLIMDEPTADLDPLLRNHMLELIKKINKRGRTIILTTQLLGEMDKICDKIVILFNKNIIEQGSPKEIKAKYNVKDLDGVFNSIFSKKEESKELTLKDLDEKLDKLDKERNKLDKLDRKRKK